MLGYLVAIAISGAVVGALARLAIPGPNPMGCLATVLVGVAGSMVAGIVGRLLFGRNYVPGLLLSVLCATALVWLITRNHPARRGPRR